MRSAGAVVRRLSPWPLIAWFLGCAWIAEPIWLREPNRDPMVDSPNHAMARRNQRVAAHLHLVRGVARHYAACTPEREDDLQQVGVLGLIRAAERFDTSSGVPFAAFAKPHIKGAVLHYLRDVAPLLRLSRRQQERAYRLERQCGAATSERRRLPAADQEALDQLRCLQSVALMPPWQLQEVQRADDEVRLEHRWLPSAAANEAIGPNALMALQRLNLRQRQVVEAVVLKGETLRTVGGRLGISAATVHRVLHQTLAELRRQLSPASGAQGC